MCMQPANPCSSASCSLVSLTRWHPHVPHPTVQKHILVWACASRGACRCSILVKPVIITHSLTHCLHHCLHWHIMHRPCPLMSHDHDPSAQRAAVTVESTPILQHKHNSATHNFLTLPIPQTHLVIRVCICMCNHIRSAVHTPDDSRAMAEPTTPSSVYMHLLQL